MKERTPTLFQRRYAHSVMTGIVALLRIINGYLLYGIVLLLTIGF